MTINIFTTEKVQCVNNTNNENNALVEVNNNDEEFINLDHDIYNIQQLVIQEPNESQHVTIGMLKELTGDDTISVREYYENKYLYGSFEEFINIKLN
jgi:hypothetical protein